MINLHESYVITQRFKLVTARFAVRSAANDIEGATHIPNKAVFTVCGVATSPEQLAHLQSRIRAEVTSKICLWVTGLPLNCRSRQQINVSLTQNIHMHETWYMSHIMRKPDCSICDEQRLGPAWISMQPDQSLPFSYEFFWARAFHRWNMYGCLLTPHLYLHY